MYSGTSVNSNLRDHPSCIYMYSGTSVNSNIHATVCRILVAGDILQTEFLLHVTELLLRGFPAVLLLLRRFPVHSTVGMVVADCVIGCVLMSVQN